MLSFKESEMAYILDEEEKKDMTTSGVVGSGVVGSSNNGYSPNTSNQPSGTGFINLDTYLNANKGRGSDVAGMAFGDDVSNANSFMSENNNTASDIFRNSRNNINTNKTNASNIVNGMSSDASNIKDSALGILNTSAPSAYNYGNIETKGAAIGNVLGDAFKKDNQIANIMDGGKKSYSTYTTNFGNLDRFLLNADQAGISSLNRIKSKANDVSNNIKDTKSSIDSSIKSEADSLQSAKDSIKNAAKSIKIGKEDTLGKKASIFGKENTGNTGFKGASIGDVISDDENVDIQALSEIGGLDYAPYAKTYNAGTRPPIVDSVKSGHLPQNLGALKNTSLGKAIQAADKLSSGIKNPIKATQTNLGNLSNYVSNAGQKAGDYIKEKSAPIVEKLTPQAPKISLPTPSVPSVSVKKIKWR